MHTSSRACRVARRCSDLSNASGYWMGLRRHTKVRLRKPLLELTASVGGAHPTVASISNATQAMSLTPRFQTGS